MLACPHPETRCNPLFQARDFITGDPFQVAECQGCGFHVTLPQPPPEDLGRYYPAAYYGALTGKRFPTIVERLQDALYDSRARKVEELNDRKPGQVLDIGCGRGFLLRAFQRRGWDVQGTELSEQSAQYARLALKLPIHMGALEDLSFDDEAFDAVVMWHVLEHVHNPRGVLREVHRMLKPGGVFLVAVPNFGSLEARLTRNKWFHLDVPRHLNHFTYGALRTALEATGFEICRRGNFAPEYDCFSFVQSWLNRLGVRHNLLYHLLRVRGARVLQQDDVGWLHGFLTCLLAPLLGVISVPATLLAGLLGQAATMTLYARKRPH
jgi:SAM-dependent methyltransferase